MRPLNAPPSPEPSDYAKLINIAESLFELSTTAPPAQIIRIYSDYFEMYEQIMLDAMDAKPYESGYIMLRHYVVSEDALLNGQTTLDNLNHVVSQSLQMLP